MLRRCPQRQLRGGQSSQARGLAASRQGKTALRQRAICG